MKIKNGNYETLMTELHETQSQLESCGIRYSMLVSELAHRTSTSLTPPTGGYQILKEHLDLKFTDLTCAMKSISLHLKNEQQFAVSPLSTLKSLTSGMEQKWSGTWYDSLIMFFSTSLITHLKSFLKLSSLPKENAR